MDDIKDPKVRPSLVSCTDLGCPVHWRLLDDPAGGGVRPEGVESRASISELQPQEQSRYRFLTNVWQRDDQVVAASRGRRIQRRGNQLNRPLPVAGASLPCSPAREAP